MFFPVSYHQPLFRPPAEANSIIIQATLGCSWNKCAFCEMYSNKKFKIRNIESIEKDIITLSKSFPFSRKVFLADGNSFVLSFNKLIEILFLIRKSFPSLQRVSCYALPSDILTKSSNELLEIKEAGLKLLYIGIETGDDELLNYINKRETYLSTLEGINKAQNAGIDTSIMIINGLGGKKYSYQHAINSAKIINQINPKYLSVLTLSFPYGESHYISKFKGQYITMDSADLLKELYLFISKLEIKNTIFRTDHISNAVVLKGVLSKNKDNMLQTIEKAFQFTINQNRAIKNL